MSYTYKYPRPMLTADCIVIDSARHVLLVERRNDPYRGCWALPGGFMEMDETIEQCAARELKEETGIEIDTSDLTLVGVFSALDRDPRGRTVTAAYMAHVAEGTPAHAGDDAAALRWWPLSTLPPLAFDHQAVIHSAIATEGEEVHPPPQNIRQ